MDGVRGVAVRSYRDVVDVVERRIFRIDRWRLPTPHGVPIQAIAYAGVCLVVVVFAAGLPVVGALLGLLPASVRYLALPAVAGWALTSLSIDGRRPHHAMLAAARHRARRRTLAGLRPSIAVGTSFAPVGCVQVASAGDEGRYRRGRVRGPALVTLRYPAGLVVERGWWPLGRVRVAGLPGASRVRVRSVAGRPLIRGHEVRVPDGAELVVE